MTQEDIDKVELILQFYSKTELIEMNRCRKCKHSKKGYMCKIYRADPYNFRANCLYIFDENKGWPTANDNCFCVKWEKR
jgi:hypothetical protein